MKLFSPIFSTYRAYSNMTRMRKILQVIFRNGLGIFFQRLRHLVSRRDWRESPEQESAPLLFARLRKVMEELGPVYVKLGQMLSTRPDLVGEECAKELSLLQDQATPFPFEQTRQLLERELHGTLEELFAEFSSEPAAAASLSQGYNARLKDGTPVFVKVQRPRVLKNIRADMGVLLFLADQLHEDNPDLRFLMLPRVVRQFRQSLEEEADFHGETGNLLRFAQQFQGNPKVHVPRIYPDYCSDHVLTMERIQGIKLTRPEELQNAGLDPRVLCGTLADLMLQQFFTHGFFHADPHPGNLFALPENTVCFLDFGLCGRLTEEEKRLFCRLVVSLLERNEQHAAQLLLRLCDYEEEPDETELECAVGEFIDRFFHGSLKQLNVPAALSHLYAMCHRLKIAMKPHVYLMVKAMGTMDGVLRTLDPDYDLEKQLRPALMRVVLRQFNPHKSLHQHGEDLLEILEMASRAPSALRTLGTKLLQGKVTFQQEFPQMEEFLQAYRQRQRQRTTAILAVGILLNSTWLISLQLPRPWHCLHYLGLAGLALASLLIASLLLDLFRS